MSAVSPYRFSSDGTLCAPLIAALFTCRTAFVAHSNRLHFALVFQRAWSTMRHKPPQPTVVRIGIGAQRPNFHALPFPFKRVLLSIAKTVTVRIRRSATA